ncbi:MAG: MarR family winged helix-turn-helix transcriptional regulator, partial [Rhodosalinus sp.]
MTTEPPLQRALSRDEMRLFDIPVRRLAERFRALVERDALRGAEIDLAEWRVVFCLVQDGPLRPNVLALRAVVPPRRIGRMLAGLQRRGLVARRIDPFDRRRAVVEANGAWRGGLSRSAPPDRGDRGRVPRPLHRCGVCHPDETAGTVDPARGGHAGQRSGRARRTRAVRPFGAADRCRITAGSGRPPLHKLAGLGFGQPVANLEELREELGVRHCR